MNLKITRPDGTIIEITDATPEIVSAFLAEPPTYTFLQKWLDSSSVAPSLEVNGPGFIPDEGTAVRPVFERVLPSWRPDAFHPKG